MVHLVEQLAFLDLLLRDWEVVRMLMHPVSPALEKELAEVASRLTAAQTSDEIAIALDDLLDLTSSTPAYDYVKTLIQRSNAGAGTAQVRGTLQEPAFAAGLTAELEQGNALAGKALGPVVGEAVKAMEAPVFFATNRLCSGNDYGFETCDRLNYGRVRVTIPVAAHRIGHLETPHWWTLFPNSNPRERFVVLDSKDIEPLTQEQFVASLGMTFNPESSSDLLIFVHGYNVTFEDAARRAAQLSYDLPFSGPVVLFSWPSLGRLAGYGADGERAADSAVRLVEFLFSLEGGPWKRIHFIAHSMGSRMLVLGLADHQLPKIPLSQLVLVAADIDTEIFKQKYLKFANPENRITSYASKLDRALLISAWLHQLNRLGFVRGEPPEVDGIETIDASYVDTGLIGHSYFNNTRTVLTDLGYLLRVCLSAQQRGLRQPVGKKYWMFPR